MRSAPHTFIVMQDMAFSGMVFHADYCAEHEWGIRELECSLGVDTEDVGMGRRKATTYDKRALHFFEDGDRTCLIYGMTNYHPGKPMEIPRDLKSSYALSRDEHIGSAWDDRSFGILVETERWGTQIKALWGALINSDFCVWRSGGGPFQNPGLCVGIASTIPQAAIDLWAKYDQDKIDLRLAAEATGIEKRLRATWPKTPTATRSFARGEGCQWFALSPRWVDEKGKAKTKYPVMFWLNPCDQENNNFGWYSVEDLDAWIKGEGPIPKR